MTHTPEQGSKVHDKQDLIIPPGVEKTKPKYRRSRQMVLAVILMFVGATGAVRPSADHALITFSHDGEEEKEEDIPLLPEGVIVADYFGGSSEALVNTLLGSLAGVPKLVEQLREEEILAALRRGEGEVYQALLLLVTSSGGDASFRAERFGTNPDWSFGAVGENVFYVDALAFGGSDMRPFSSSEATAQVGALVTFLRGRYPNETPRQLIERVLNATIIRDFFEDENVIFKGMVLIRDSITGLLNQSP